MPTKKERAQAMEAAAESLVARGFVPDGETDRKTVRTGSAERPIYGKSGGQLTTVGGRARFALPDTKVKATVGAMSVALYRIEGKGLSGVRYLATVDTVDPQALAAALDAVPEVPARPDADEGAGPRP